jgi:hypothetical protein
MEQRLLEKLIVACVIWNSLLLTKPLAHYCICKGLLLISILTHTNPAHNLPPCWTFILIFYSHLCISVCVFLFWSSVLACYMSHPYYPWFVLMMLREENRLWGTSLCMFLQPAAAVSPHCLRIQRSPGFTSRPVNMKSVVDKLALAPVWGKIWVLFFPVSNHAVKCSVCFLPGSVQ